MKTNLILKTIFLSLIISSNVNGQSGVISYESKTKMNFNVEGDDAEAISNLPKEHISMKELIFNSDASLYRSVEKKQEEAPDNDSEHGHQHMMIKIDEPEINIYSNLKEKIRTEQREFLSRKFLIEIPFSSSNWKITGRQKMILGYNCEEAQLVDTLRNITAWFTSKIPLSTGPNGICNLPGLVLYAEFNKGETIFEAKNIDLKPIDDSMIIKLTEGKKMSRDDFNKMVMEKTKEMDEQNGGKGNVIIRIKK